MSARRLALPIGLSLVAAIGLVVSAEPPQARKRRPPPQAPIARAIAQASPSVVRVELIRGTPRGDLPRWRFHRRVAKRTVAAGIVVGADLVVTHAVQALLRDPVYRVTTRSGRRFTAHLIHLDGARETAVLQTTQPLDVSPAGLGQSSGVEPGNLVIALGDPFGVAADAQPTATLGVLEGRVKLDALETSYRGSVLLTDAAINPGSEGGALIDLSGRVIGLLAPLAQDLRLRRPTMGLQGPGGLSGYAVPIEAVQAALRAVRRGAGAGFRGRAHTRGVEVLLVTKGGRAAAAGLQVGDVIRTAAKAPVTTLTTLRAALRTARGKRLALTVERDGQTRAVELDLSGGK